jgi:uncharacterized protein (TIGR00369 family)
VTDGPPDEVTEEIATMFESLPFAELLGVEITEVRDGYAEGSLALREELSANPDAMVVHGGVTYALADTVAGAAMVARTLDVTPTIDMRMDYLAPATSDLTAVAEVVRDGEHVAAVDVLVTDAGAEHVATARGTFKTSGSSADSPWVRNRSSDDPDDA